MNKKIQQYKEKLKLYEEEKRQLGAHLYFRDFATMDMCLRKHLHKELEGYMKQAQHTLRRLLWVKNKIEMLEKQIEQIEIEKIKF